jgi:hypothetical protein
MDATVMKGDWLMRPRVLTILSVVWLTAGPIPGPEENQAEQQKALAEIKKLNLPGTIEVDQSRAGKPVVRVFLC